MTCFIVEQQVKKIPAFWLTNQNVIHVVPIEGAYPLMVVPEPLSKEKLKSLFEQADGSPMKFARLIEQEHGIGIQ